ncbi:MAG: glycosyltransferase family 9 protein, partial [Planctomycetota bacterium]
PRYTESNLDKTTVLRVEDLECSPCHLKTCPLTHHRCMTWIEPDQVVEAAADLLRRFPPPPAEAPEG